MRASDRAYSTLREEIIDGHLDPGTVLGEVEQSARLGISRTPLREALARLVADGLAESSRGRGAVVTAVSLGEAPQLFDLRIALETLAARRAAERAALADRVDPAEAAEGTDLPSRFAALAARFERATSALARGTDPSAYYALTTELDAALDAACANPYLAESLRGLRLHLGRLRRLARNSPGRLADSAREHAAIARAVAAGDAELAAAATTVHLRQALAHLQDQGADPPTLSPPQSPTPTTTSTTPPPLQETA
ncbi:GntR family transcriptional regulator [Brachybacterium sp.]|uniref:GntR family transcriptional regulator n=1 Tax=Brachybacterium sp. TaxID=1891286 RepID=UPI002ED35537